MSRSKTEHLKTGGVDDGEELKLQREKAKRAKNLKYLVRQLVAMEDVKKN